MLCPHPHPPLHACDPMTLQSARASDHRRVLLRGDSVWDSVSPRVHGPPHRLHEPAQVRAQGAAAVVLRARVGVCGGWLTFANFEGGPALLGARLARCSAYVILRVARAPGARAGQARPRKA